MSNASRLLVVDDDQDLRDTLAEQLGFYDEFQISTAATATAAVEAVKGDRIDLAMRTSCHAAARSASTNRRIRCRPTGAPAASTAPARG